jgi:hypothetical protein
MREEVAAELDRVRRSYRAELVPYKPPEQGLSAVRIRVERR